MDIEIHPKGTACFHWKSIQRQLRISGVIEKISSEESDEYFSTRPRLSQIGAWASLQSQVMKSSSDLPLRIAEYTFRFNIEKIPRPPHWGGYRIIPFKFEFWKEQPYRLHSRLEFTTENGNWSKKQLFP